jgi:cell division GTPase FtsZ
VIWTWVLLLTLHFAGDKEWRGNMDVTMKFDNEALCRTVRRAIWSQFKDADGVLGDCTQVVVPLPVKGDNP